MYCIIERAVVVWKDVLTWALEGRSDGTKKEKKEGKKEWMEVEVLLPRNVHNVHILTHIHAYPTCNPVTGRYKDGGGDETKKKKKKAEKEWMEVGK